MESNIDSNHVTNSHVKFLSWNSYDILKHVYHSSNKYNYVFTLASALTLVLAFAQTNSHLSIHGDS